MVNRALFFLLCTLALFAKEQESFLPVAPSWASIQELGIIERPALIKHDLSIWKERSSSQKFFQILLQYDIRDHFAALPQTFYFLIDRSDKSSNRQFASYLNAVSVALCYLPMGSFFYIALIDDEIVSFSAEPIKLTQKSFDEAKLFLDAQLYDHHPRKMSRWSALVKNILAHQKEAKSFSSLIFLAQFGLSDIEKLSANFSQEVENTQVVLTYQGKLENSKIYTDFAYKWGGDLVTSSTIEGFSQKMANAIHKIAYPVLTDCDITLLKGQGTLFRSQIHRSHLFMQRPIALYGVTDPKTDKITLLIQGKHQGKWVHIRKEVPFLKSTKTSQRILRDLFVWEELSCSK